MRSLVNFLGVSVLIAACCGCGQEPTRDPAIDAKGPIVNPLAPGARAGAKLGVAMPGGLYTAAPGMKTGIPK